MEKVDCRKCARETCPVWGDLVRRQLDMECSGFVPKEPVHDTIPNEADGIVIGGVYQHYKGNKYQVLYAAKHTETGEDLVIYTRLYDPTKQVWARPATMWNETVVKDGKPVKRFTLVEGYEEAKGCHSCGWHTDYRTCEYDSPCVDNSGWKPITGDR